MSREETTPAEGEISAFQKITELSKYIAVRHCFIFCNQSLLAEGLRTVETILLSKTFIPLHLCSYRHVSSSLQFADVAAAYFSPLKDYYLRGPTAEIDHFKTSPLRLSKYPSEYASAASERCENCHFSNRKKVF